MKWIKLVFKEHKLEPPGEVVVIVGVPVLQGVTIVSGITNTYR